MEFKALEGKNVEIDVNGEKYLRHAIKTHYIQLGESYIDIIEKYVKPIYEEGDILSISEKIISLCQKPNIIHTLFLLFPLEYILFIKAKFFCKLFNLIFTRFVC